MTSDEMILYLKGDAILLHRDDRGRIVRTHTGESCDYFGCVLPATIVIITNDETHYVNLFIGFPIDMKNLINDWEALQKILIPYDSDIIQYVDNPSEEIKRLAVRGNGYAIQHIYNPSEEVQRLAVQQDGPAIRYIRNPSEEVQKLAIEKYPRAIKFIPNPSEEMKTLHSTLWRGRHV